MSKIERPIIPIGIKEDMTYEKARDVIEVMAIEITGELAKGKNELLEIYLDAIDKSIEAIEKQMPKKPIEDTKEKGWLIWNCPVCGKEVGRVLETLQHHCECGQAIDWSDA